MSFENLESKKILVIGEAASLNAESLNFLLLKDFEHIYLINPKEEIADHVKSFVDTGSFSILDKIDELKQNVDSDLCLVGFPALSNDVFKRFKNFKKNVLIFFDSSIGAFASIWKKNFKSIKLIEEPILDYSFEENNEVHFTDKLSKKVAEFFANRGNEIDAFRRFMVSNRLRCAKIIGFDGIGKTSFLNHLKKFYKLEENCFEFYFTSKDNTLFDLLYEIGKFLSVRIIDKEIPSIKKDFNPACIIRVFEKFDKINNASIIFRNFHLIYNIDANEFFDHQLAVFFHNLIIRNTYNGNRVYFVANTEFSLPYLQSEDLSTSIVLPPIHSRYIKIIMEQAFLQKENRILANQIMQLDDKVIDELIGGHPHIGKLFVKACENASIDTIIEDTRFRKKFEEEKVRYLFDIITLDSKHKGLDCLNYLACINEPFHRRVIDKIANEETADIISYLRSRFLLNIEFFDNGNELYEVPILIRKFVRNNIPTILYKNINNSIGDIYWKFATDFNTPSIEMMSSYRAAEYHYKEGENTEMLRRLILLFKEKYLQIAISLYGRHAYYEAYILFKELFNSNYLIDDRHANFFLVSCSKIEAADTRFYAEKVHLEFPSSKFITNTIASYYFRHEEYETALRYVTKSIDIQNDDYVALGLYYNILSKTGRESEAYEFYEKKLNSHLTPKVKDEDRISHVRFLMNYYQIIGFNGSFYQLTERSLFYLPEKQKQYFKDYLNAFIDEKVAHKISVAFQNALKSKFPDLQLKNDYKKYIARQKNIQISSQNFTSLKKVFLEKVASNIKNNVVDIEKKLKKSIQIVNAVLSIDAFNPIAQLALPILLINQHNFNLIESLMINPEDKLKIIFLSANPNHTSQLQLDREFRTIEEHIQRSKERDKIKLVSKWAVRLPDFTKALLDENFQIIHFSGHGDNSGIAFENDNGEAEMINSDGLKQLFSMFKKELKCIVLNACYTEELAKVISEEGVFVIGMTDAIEDENAIKFSIGFYQAHGSGRDIETAFKLGLVYTANSSNKSTPSLWRDGVRVL